MQDIKTLDKLAESAGYSFMDTLDPDPNATADGVDYEPRQVFSGQLCSGEAYSY